MISILLAALFQALTPPQAAVTAIAPSTPTVTNPEWIRRPGAQDMASYYPIAAARENLSGNATVSCSVTAEGLLINCGVLQEFPAGAGFGDAALHLSTLFKMRPLTKDGRSVAGGTVRIPIRFMISGGGMDPLSGMLACYGQAAAAAERDPDDASASYAFGFFAAQAAIREAQSKSTPQTLEQGLVGARLNALKNPDAAKYGPSLKACLALIPAHQ